MKTFIKSLFVISLFNFTLIQSAASSSTSSQQTIQSQNIISDSITFDRNAAEYIKENGITEEEIKKVLLDGRRISTHYGKHIKKFKERKKQNALIVSLDRSESPNKVTHITRALDIKFKHLIFTYHATKRMKERNISKEMVYNTLLNGKLYYDKKNDSKTYRTEKDIFPIIVALSKDEKVVISAIREKEPDIN